MDNLDEYAAAVSSYISCEDIWRNSDWDAYRQAQYALNIAAKVSKCNFKNNVEQKLSSNDSSVLINTHYNRFEKQMASSSSLPHLQSIWDILASSHAPTSLTFTCKFVDDVLVYLQVSCKL